MSKKEWLFLFVLFVAYLFLGATIFYYIERKLEEDRREQDKEQQLLLRLQLEKHYQPVREARSITALAQHISQYCNKEFMRALEESNLSLKEGPSETPYLWTYYNAFFFALTTLSTIGYGNLHPSSDEGKMILIVYCLIGIPFTGIILSRLGDFFGSRLMRAHNRYKNDVYDSRLTLVLDVLIYLVPGIVVFILAPTIIFMKFENWSFYDAFYYAFVTLATIGFGDLVAGQDAGTDTIGETLYKIFIIVWIMFGLGYLVMILGLITRAMKSKKLAKVELKLASRFKATQTKIWREFLEDVNTLRKALNESYINKTKPVYRDKQQQSICGLSRSMPNLSEWPEPISKAELEEWRKGHTSLEVRVQRRRAMSEGVQALELSLPRVMSEGALENIDIETTFKDRPRPSLAHTELGTEEFLTQIVNQRRLSVFDPTLHDGGYDLFSDDEILESEEFNEKAIEEIYQKKRQRLRARSDAFFGDTNHLKNGYDHQITWSGSDSLHARTMIKNMHMRAKADLEAGEDDKPDKPPQVNNLRRLSAAALHFFSGDKKKKEDKKRKSGPNIDSDDEDLQDFLTSPGGRRPSLLDVLGPITNSASGSNPSLSPVLEQTSLADFIRIMSTLRSIEGGQQDSTNSAQLPKVPAPRHGSLSNIFSEAVHLQTEEPPLPREVLRTRESASPTGMARTRRYSQAPSRQELIGIRQRAASLSQGGGLPADRRMSGRYAPPVRALSSSGSTTPVLPSLVVTSPDGQHRFKVETVNRIDFTGANRRRLRRNSLSDY